MTPPLALITNDDGIDSAGLHELARVVLESGFEVVVAAPDAEASGSGAAITGTDASGRVPMQKRSISGLEEVRAYAVRAAPALIALIAGHGAFGAPPDYVFSGINRGANIGRAILHSGTVGAALTGGAGGARSLAVSLDVGLHHDERYDEYHWGCAAAAVRTLLPALAAAPSGAVFNLNVPNVGGAEHPRLRQASLAAFGTVQTMMAEREAGQVRIALTDTTTEPRSGTDAAYLAAGYATVTNIQGVTSSVSPVLDSLGDGNGNDQPPRNR